MLARSVASLLLLLNAAFASNLWPAPISLKARDVNPDVLYPEYNISVPVDHFHNDSQYEPHSNDYFNLRYWYDSTYYVQGGPVIVLQGGETSGQGRLPYLQKGIVQELSAAVGGIGVILEHRYYGTSFPTNLTTENLRFLTTDQALADQAYFANNIVFPGLENLTLTAPGTPYFAYGGSYAGALVAFLRKLYPDAYWGAISSSGVTEALYDFWEYYEAVRQYGPPDCISTHTKLINIADNILLSNNTAAIANLKSLFNATGITYDDDFANAISQGIEYWQSRNWDPEVNDPTFFEYCGNITATNVLDSSTMTLQSNVTSLITSTGYPASPYTTAMLNWISWFSNNILSECDTSSETLDECFGYHNASSPTYTDKSVENYNSLSWPYQYCTQWGYLQSGSTVPPDRLPLISRLVSVAWNALICNFAFDIHTPSNTSIINKYGAYNISYPRLAIIGGEADPWRAVSPLADVPLDGIQPDRLIAGGSTVSEPLIIIPGAVHHWDENGVFANQTTADFPPPEIKLAKAMLVNATISWMEQWVDHCNNGGNCTYAYKGVSGS